MDARRILLLLVCFMLVAATAFAAPVERRDTPPSKADLGLFRYNDPQVLTSSAVTTWLQVHSDSSYCPGDPGGGHGGEATDGPGPLETWCFEGGPGDSCGTLPPWDTNCFSHVDIRTEPSQCGINFWHVDTYRADQRDYCGNYALWCGSDSLWDGQAVECGTWCSPPGYGNWWNCVVQLTLPSSFGVAEGCTLLFDPRYDLECGFDYLYLEFWNGSAWEELAVFNATSDNPGAGCDGPDYWGNSDTDRLLNCDWQERFDPDMPAFYRIITPDTLGVAEAPKFRWRLESDGNTSDGDCRLDTDGGALIDNVWVWGDTTRYEEDFESGVIDNAYWSFPLHDGVIDLWHISYDPDPPDETGSCVVDSSYVYRGRPEGGYQSGQSWRNQWAYRLMTPAVPMLNTGCKVQFDVYCDTKEWTCDYRAPAVRFYDSSYNRWCMWKEPWRLIITTPCWGSTGYWRFNWDENVTWEAPAHAESVQFAWFLYDYGEPSEPCYGQHGKTELITDNVSIGFYDANATVISGGERYFLHDTFFSGDSSICGYNQSFDAYDPDTVEAYRIGGDNNTLPWNKQLMVDVWDPDGVSSVELFGSIDDGDSWESKELEQRDGWYYGTVCPSDFGLTSWAPGNRIRYYVKVVDELANEEYFPAEAGPAHPGHTGDLEDYLYFSVLPRYPEEFTGPRILLVDDNMYSGYNWSQCLLEADEYGDIQSTYTRTLVDAGYCFGIYRTMWVGDLEPVWFAGLYDAVIWFTGTEDYELIGAQAQQYIRDYLGAGGKLMLCGDRLADDMINWGSDALGGDFAGGIMGISYLEEMPEGYTYPYVQAAGVESLNVLGQPLAVELDTLLVFRECPYPKDMSYVLANTSPPAGYTAQPLLEVTNPTVAAADAAIYTEYLGVGQCVFVDFDLSGTVNHTAGFCTGITDPAAPDFDAGYYDGRVDLMLTVLADIFGLPSSGSGGEAGLPVDAPEFRWALGQSSPNPSMGPVEIRYEVARPGAVRLTVYDTRGRLVRVLIDDSRAPGQYSARWDCRDVSGRRVADGVYFYRLEAAGYESTRKMLVLR